MVLYTLKNDHFWDATIYEQAKAKPHRFSTMRGSHQAHPMSDHASLLIIDNASSIDQLPLFVAGASRK